MNQYIHGGEGILKEIVQKIGFQIYKTEEMMQLIEYIREYNDDAEEEQLNFYGFDMQRIRYSFDALKKECIAEGVNLSFLDNFIIDGQWNQNYSYAEKKDLLMKLKKTLELKEFNGDLIHFVDVLLQNVEVLHRKDTDGSLLRDQYMAENVSWILQKEQQRRNDCIFISGHNEHVAKWGSYDSMGKLLSNQYRYYVIGTNFYKTRCNLPEGNHKHTIQTFYSHDPLAKTAKLAGFKMCWIDFSSLEEGTEIKRHADAYTYMGTLGESYSIMNRFLPPSYRMFQPPTTLYDSMIYVSNASPTKIIECLLIYMLQRNYNKHVEKWGAEWLRVGSTLTLKPDLDNANVGMISLLYVSCRLGFSAAFCFLIRIWRQIGGTTLCRIKKVMQEGDRK